MQLYVASFHTRIHLKHGILHMFYKRNSTQETFEMGMQFREIHWEKSLKRTKYCSSVSGMRRSCVCVWFSYERKYHINILEVNKHFTILELVICFASFHIKN